MENYFDYKYRLYFRTPFTMFSQCKDPVYDDNIEVIRNAIENVDQQKGYTEYMIITKTENGDVIERNLLDRPKMLVKTPKH